MGLASQTVYSKALAIIVGLSILLGVAVVSMSQFIIVREFREVEVGKMTEEVERLGILVDGEPALAEKALDAWIASQGEQGGAAQAIGFLAGGAVEEVVPLEGWPTLLADFSAAVRNVSLPESGSGFFLLEGRQAVAASWRPWPLEGPARESLLVALRPLTAEVFSKINVFVEGDISFYSLDGFVLGTPGTEALVVLVSGDQELVIEQGAYELTGISLLRAWNQQPIGFLQLVRGMPLQQQGASAVRVFLTVMALAGGVLFIFLWVLLDRTILARVRELTRQVEQEKQKGRLPVQLAFSGGDELGTLARRVEELASLLDRTQQQYRQVIEDQTELICRFTPDLQMTFANGVIRRNFPQASDLPSLAECFGGDAADFLTRRFRRLDQGDPIETFQHRLEFPSEGHRWLRSTLRKNFDRRGKCTGGQWVAADVTAQVEAEREVHESEQRLRLLSRRLMNLQDEERRRIARELHDSTAQSLSALEMNASQLAPLAMDERSTRLVEETRRIASDCCKELRNISYLLHPPLLDEVGLAFAIKWFADGFSERTGIAVELNLQEDFPRLEKELETALFRIVQEACANIYKHSGATNAAVSLNKNGRGDIVMIIDDNGHGFEAEPGMGSTPNNPGIGLAGMRERLQQFSGSLKVTNSPRGVSLAVTIPYQNA